MAVSLVKDEEALSHYHETHKTANTHLELFQIELRQRNVYECREASLYAGQTHVISLSSGFQSGGLSVIFKSL